MHRKGEREGEGGRNKCRDKGRVAKVFAYSGRRIVGRNGDKSRGKHRKKRNNHLNRVGKIQ